MKGRILKILRSETGIVSGGKLSSELGISRVSIWKHIHKLHELGYNIITAPKGYRLISSPDALFPWEFPAREASIRYFSEVTSTMDIARDLARKGCPHFTVVLAGRQKKGRGRLKRSWLSAEGGLYFTMVLRPQIPTVFSYMVNFVAALVLVRTLRKMFSIEALVKWPNDILINGKKVSGLLSEMEAEADMVSFVNIGLGINVNNDPTPAEPAAISLKKIMGREISRKKLLAAFLDEFENRINADNAFDNVISEWKKYTSTLNQHVKIVTINDELKGVAINVDENGALVLKLEDGSTKRIIYGDCFYQE